MRRYLPLLIAGSALVAAACRDAVAPTRSEDLTTIAAFGGGPNSWAAAVGPSDGANATSVSFTIKAGGNTVTVGEFTIAFDANAVCDPSTSGYGPTYWTKPCAPLGQDIVITARTFKVGDQSHVDFSPDVRFNPDVNVTISAIRTEIKDVRRLTPPMRAKYGIWYTTRIGNTRFFVDESFSDRTLAMHFDTATGKVWRKIRHFSGVVIRTGYCTDNPEDPSCAPEGAE